jgi:hypothetical protein
MPIQREAGAATSTRTRTTAVRASSSLLRLVPPQFDGVSGARKGGTRRLKEGIGTVGAKEDDARSFGFRVSTLRAVCCRRGSDSARTVSEKERRDGSRVGGEVPGVLTSSAFQIKGGGEEHPATPHRAGSERRRGGKEECPNDVKQARPRRHVLPFSDRVCGWRGARLS